MSAMTDPTTPHPLTNSTTDSAALSERERLVATRLCQALSALGDAGENAQVPGHESAAREHLVAALTLLDQSAAAPAAAASRYVVDVHDVYSYEVFATDEDEADARAFALHHAPDRHAKGVECYVYVVDGPRLAAL